MMRPALWLTALAQVRAQACIDYDVGFEGTMWTVNWARSAACSGWLASFSDSGLAQCQDKIGKTAHTFSERFSSWSGNADYGTGIAMNFSTFPQDAIFWDYYCGASCAALGVYADHCKPTANAGFPALPPSPPSPPIGPTPPSTPPHPPSPPPSPPPPPPPPSPPASPPQEDESGLAIGAIIGIAIGGVVLILGVAAVVFILSMKGKKKVEPTAA